MGRRSASTVGAAGPLGRLWSAAGGRVLSGGVAAVVAVPLALVLARADGLPGQRDELTGGGAWLASPAQGAVTLIDGASEQVVGAVRAPTFRTTDDLSAVQAGSSAYLVSSSAGTVSRVDGGTYEVSTPVQFGAGGSGGALQVYAGKSAAYVVDGQRRTASVVDPVTLRVRERLALTSQPGPGQSVVDSAGRLWVVDATGLDWFDRAGKHVRSEAGGASMRLVLVAGRPVLVDLQRARAGQLSDDGSVRSWSCLDLPGDQAPGADQVQLIGSNTLGRVLAAIPATGTLVAAGNGGDACGQTLDVGKPGEAFGPLVESGGYVFVPNRTTGHTVVVDLAAHQVVADLDVVRAGARLELLAKDGLVFYNDLDGDKAGVLQFSGGRWTVGKGLQKFSAGKDGAKILAPSGNKTHIQPQQPKPDNPADKPPADRSPTDPPDAGDPPAGGDPPVPPGGGTVDPSSPPPPPPPPGGPGNGTLNVRVVGGGFVTASAPKPLNQPAGIQCGAGPGCAWQYPDGTTAVLRVPLAPTPDLVLDTLDGCAQKPVQGANQICSVVVSGTVTVTATFIPKPPVQVHVNVTTTGSGTVTATPAGGAPASCTPSCALTVVAGTAVRLSATAGGGNYLSDWTTAGCAATASTCDLTAGSDTTVTVAFAPLLVLTARAAGAGSGSVSGAGLSCGGGTCTGSFKAGATVDLTAAPGANSAFTSWSGCAPPNALNCSVTMSADTTVTASFRALDTTPPVVTISDGRGHTVTGASGDVSVTLPDFSPYTVTATATDPESAVTLIVLKRAVSFDCGTIIGGGRIPTEIARSSGGPVSNTLDVRDFCGRPTDNPRNVSAVWVATATSEGGTAPDTSSFIAGHAE
ncbi:MAG TPA: hypothetical protein VMU51_12690 [Mycobacteriales bacterium]|nr:hypothetical protein [Mycobacteriales bacterium]